MLDCVKAPILLKTHCGFMWMASTEYCDEFKEN